MRQLGLSASVSEDIQGRAEAETNPRDKLVGLMCPNASWFLARFPAISQRLSFSGQKVYQERRHANRFLVTFRNNAWRHETAIVGTMKLAHLGLAPKRSDALRELYSKALMAAR
jgi:hypothetical protein